MALCIHLLRLRPTVEQLKSWNKDGFEPSKTLETCGWTAFLRELTGQYSLEGLEPREKLVHRKRILEDLYDIAEKEESFFRGECGRFAEIFPCYLGKR